MMRLPDRTLPAGAQTKLEEYQQAIDALPDYGTTVTSSAETRRRRSSRSLRATFGGGSSPPSGRR